jgi:hypothetical protein
MESTGWKDRENNQWTKKCNKKHDPPHETERK